MPRYEITGIELIKQMLSNPMPENDECLKWPRHRMPKYQYGRLRGGDGKHLVLAHRASYEILHGPIPEGLHVLHACDNPPCFRPSHLSLGTDIDNASDCVARARRPRGEQTHKARLTETDVLAIRASIGAPLAQLGKQFGVAKSTIQQIRNRSTWQHLP